MTIKSLFTKLPRKSLFIIIFIVEAFQDCAFFSGNALAAISHRKPVYGLTVNSQNDEIIATAGEDGRLLLYDIREAPNQGNFLPVILLKTLVSLRVLL